MVEDIRQNSESPRLHELFILVVLIATTIAIESVMDMLTAAAITWMGHVDIVA